MEDFVTVINNSDEDFQYRYLFKLVTLRPGASTVIPWEHMVLIAGSPYANPNNGERMEEWRRLRSRYSIIDAKDWDEQRPDLTFLDGEGNKLMTVLNDHDGSTGIVDPNVGDSNDRRVLENAVEKLRAQMNQLIHRLNQKESEEASERRSDAREDAPRVEKNVTPPAVVEDKPRSVAGK